jgi:hypothetical protein
MIRRMCIISKLFTLFAVASLTLAQPSNSNFQKWWPRFQAAVAKRDAKAIADMTTFPAKWPLEKVRRIESRGDFIQKFDTYFPEEARQAVATGTPRRSLDGMYYVAWMKGVYDYALRFKPDGKGGYRLDSLVANDM